LDYDKLGSYTSELFENFMEYKLLLANLQDVMRDRTNYEKQDKVHAIDTDIPTLISVRAALRVEMDKIVTAVSVGMDDMIQNWALILFSGRPSHRGPGPTTQRWFFEESATKSNGERYNFIRSRR
jgi:hypothetical protein